MSFHQAEFHQRGLRDKDKQLLNMIKALDRDIQDAFGRIKQLEIDMGKVLDRKSEFWSDED